MGLFSKSSKSNDLKPAVFQTKDDANLVKGRRDSSAKIAEPQELLDQEVYSSDGDDDVNDWFPEREFTIRFDEYDEMQTTIHINDYKDSEIRKTWYKASDYDKMIQSAQKTVRKVEERDDVAVVRKGKKNAVINYRGLEAWTEAGSAQVRFAKEGAVQSVWNEQALQWDEGIYDPEKIREVYLPYTTGTRKIAHERATSDAAVYEKEKRKMEEQLAQKRQPRTLLSRSKDILGKSMRLTGDGVVMTTKFVGKTSKKTGKVALEVGKRTTRATLGVATLDPKMFGEAFSIPENKDERSGEMMRRPSLSKLNIEDRKSLRSVVSDGEGENDDGDSKTTPPVEEKKTERLKLLGVVPIPGTKLMYLEDLEQEKRDRRRNKSQLAGWEQPRRRASGKF